MAESYRIPLQGRHKTYLFFCGIFSEELIISRYKVYFQAAISFFLLSYLLILIDWKQVQALGVWSAGVVFAGVCATLLLMTLQAGRWSFLVRRIGGKNFGFNAAYKGYLTGAFFSIFMPGAIGGDVIRVKYSADESGISLKASSLVVATERLFGLAALCMYLLAGITFGGQWILQEQFDRSDLLLLGGVLLVGFMVLAFLCRQTQLALKSSLVVLLFSLAAQGIDMLTAYGFLCFLFPTTQLYWILIAMPLAFLATVLPISLGGLGVREGTLVGILSLFQVDTSIAVIFSFMIYLSKVTTGSIGGLNILLFRKEGLVRYLQRRNRP